MAQRMDDLSALGLMMDHESDWNDSEDDVDYQDENGFDEQYEPLDIAQLDDHIEEVSGFQQEESIDDDSMDMDSSTPANVDFSEPVGPALPHLPSSATPLDFFMLMVGADFFEYLATETNRYAQQNPPPASYKWQDTTASEMMLFIGMIYAMGLNVQPQLLDYWKNDPILGAPGIVHGMPILRFKALLSAIHLNDNTTAKARGEPGYDKLHKVRPFFNRLQKNFLKKYHPGRENSIDEAMVGFKGRSSLKQYMPMKTTKRGYKVWCRSDAKTGYMCDFQVYCGASGPSEHSLGTKVVLDLAKPLFGKGYHLYFDNFFSSVDLANILLTHKTGMIATTRANRKKYPKQLHKTVLARGESKHHNVGDVDCFVWQDKKQVHFINTISQPQRITMVRRKNKDGSTVDISCPESVHLYNQYMGGVDNADAKRKVYSCSRRAKKWWLRLLYFGLDVAPVNAHILQQQTPNCPAITQKDFRLELAKELMSSFSARKLPGRRSTDGGPSRFTERHFPDNLGKSLHCRICAASKIRKRTSYCYKECCPSTPVPLCVAPCFKLYHTKN